MPKPAPDVWGGVSPSDSLAQLLGLAAAATDLASTAPPANADAPSTPDDDERAVLRSYGAAALVIAGADPAGTSTYAQQLSTNAHGRALLSLLSPLGGSSEAPLRWAELADAPRPLRFRACMRRFERDLLSVLLPPAGVPDKAENALDPTSLPRACAASVVRLPAHAVLARLDCKAAQSVEVGAHSLTCSCLRDFGRLAADAIATMAVPDAPGPAIEWLGIVLGRALERDAIAAIRATQTASQPDSATTPVSADLQRRLVQRTAAIAAMVVGHTLPAPAAVTSRDAPADVAAAFAASDVDHAAYLGSDPERLAASIRAFID